MKYRLLLFLLTAIASSTIAQKKLIDSSVFNRWPTLHSPAISPNGEYVAYIMEKKPADKHTLVIQSTTNKWKKEIVGASDASFTGNSRWFVFRSNADSLCLSKLGTERIEYYPNVQSYQLVGLEQKQLIAMVRTAGGNSELLVRDLSNGTQKIFSNVIDFAFSKNGKFLLLEKDDRSSASQKKIIQWTNVDKEELQTIWESGIDKRSRPGNFAFDSKGEQVVFLTSEQENGQSEKYLWYYKFGMERAVQKMNSRTPGLPEGCKLSGAKFSIDGKRLFFEAKEVLNDALERPGVKVDIWSYTDDKLQAQQLEEINESATYKGVINLDKNEAIILQGPNEQLADDREGPDDYFLLTKAPCYPEENNWRFSCRVPLYLVNTRDGTRRLIKDTMVFSESNGFSPDRKYVLFYDHQKQVYFSYSTVDGKTVNITHDVPFPIYDKPHARAGLPKPYTPLPKNWLAENKGVIIYDEYDLWLVDPTGINSPICLTKGYGRKNGIIFRLAAENRIITEQQVLLLAFRPADKTNGFYLLNLAKPTDPEFLTMEPYLYYWPDDLGMCPKKASAANVWIVQRMSASEAPNYFVTKNFRSFQRLSNLQPQSSYNWLTAELHEWTMFDGKKSQGILYKPENFDPHKKYPVIFHFYEEKSNELHQYLIPDATGSRINIPHFVSNGYLVFVPDVHYSIGETIESIYNSVGSAAKYLSKYPWVDSSKMGLQGHSFGGFEVNALITRTNMFAAAASAAGASNLISNTGSIDSRNGYSLAYLAELSTYRMGGTIWEKKNEYIQNSPIFYADRITTPLLMFNCNGDGVVPFAQGVEFFLALRRLGKPVWMLQYDMGGHQLAGTEANDYTIRLMQFFDHYLKGVPPPKWLKFGVPAKLKGIDPGY